MAYKVKSEKNGTEYYLHGKKAANNKTTLFYFGKEAKENALDTLPEGYEVIFSSATGLPVLKKTAK